MLTPATVTVRRDVVVLIAVTTPGSQMGDAATAGPMTPATYCPAPDRAGSRTTMTGSPTRYAPTTRRSDTSDPSRLTVTRAATSSTARTVATVHGRSSPDSASADARSAVDGGDGPGGGRRR